MRFSSFSMVFKEYVWRFVQPMLPFVPFDYFGCSILVIEDDRSMSENVHGKMFVRGITHFYSP